MSANFSKCCKIRHIVRLRQMLRQWRNKAALARKSGKIPSDVPAGHVAIIVGSNCRRFVVRTAYLNHPVFKSLLMKAEEEYGFENQGPLAIPCDETVFEEILQFLARSDYTRFVNLDEFRRYCHLGLSRALDYWHDSLPLLEKRIIW